MKDGKTFHFVGGIHAALQQAKNPAKDKAVCIGGGNPTVSNIYAPGSWTHCISFFPIFMGSGENLLAGIDLAELEYPDHVPIELAMHFGP